MGFYSVHVEFYDHGKTIARLDGVSKKPQKSLYRQTPGQYAFRLCFVFEKNAMSFLASVLNGEFDLDDVLEIYSFKKEQERVVA